MKLHSAFNSESDGVVSVRANKAQSGVSLIEIMLSPFILSVGILGAVQAMIAAATSVNVSQEQLIAKQKAREALETIYTARNTQNIVWDEVRNVSDGGIFVGGL